jgi:bis(5'-nucleosyl)-tetraphosphatase (symmetrical)
MATYAIGDVQGCYAELSDLLEEVRFDAGADCLWLLGDLINRGPDSLSVVRLVRSLEGSAKIVLGNHDLHFLAIHLGGHSLTKNDTFVDLLQAQDVDELADWYCQQPFMVCDEQLGYAMTHAGIPHIWSVDEAGAYAREVEQVIRGEQRLEYFQAMYGNKPDIWKSSLRGMDRWRAITNYLTRMRLIDSRGRMDFVHKGGLTEVSSPWVPWYEPSRQEPLPVKLLFGHWAALEGHTGNDQAIALDTGCVWGGELTALRLDDGIFFSVPARK